MKSLLVAVLLAASTTLMANTNASSFQESLANRQTEQLVKNLDLCKKQANNILAINKDYAQKNAMLFEQHKLLQSLGLMDATLQHTFIQVLSYRFEARKLEIKAVLNDEQSVDYSMMLPELKKDLYKSIRFIHDRTRERYDS